MNSNPDSQQLILEQKEKSVSNFRTVTICVFVSTVSIRDKALHVSHLSMNTFALTLALSTHKSEGIKILYMVQKFFKCCIPNYKLALCSCLGRIDNSLICILIDCIGTLPSGTIDN